MTVQALYKVSKYDTIRVVSGYDGRVLCYKFNPDKHPEIASRDIVRVYAGIDSNGSSVNFISAKAYICAVVDGSIEFEKIHSKESSQ